MRESPNSADECSGVKGCFGLTTRRKNRIMFRMSEPAMKIMVITEQPRGTRTSKEDLKEGLQKDKENSIPKRLTALLGDAFRDSVEREQGAYYWTHFIKCPGELGEASGVKGFEKAACADKHLPGELAHLRPRLIISVGRMANKWLIGKAGQARDWREYVIDQLRKDEASELSLGIGTEHQPDIHRVKTIFLVHPSERSGLGWFIDQQLEQLIRRETQNALRVP